MVPVKRLMREQDRAASSPDSKPLPPSTSTLGIEQPEGGASRCPSESSGVMSVVSGGRKVCCECQKPAQLHCDSCGGNLYCADCDFKIHNSGFRFLRNHLRTNVNSNWDSTTLAQQYRAFPESGECHVSQIVRLCKSDHHMLPLFPNTPNGAGCFDVTLSFEGRNINVENFFWESSRSLTVLLPSYAEIVGVNHGPHRTLCKISVVETSLRSDPPLVWRYTYEHTHLLEKILMLKTLNVTLKDLVHRTMPSPLQGRDSSQILAS